MHVFIEATEVADGAEQASGVTERTDGKQYTRMSLTRRADLNELLKAETEDGSEDQ